MTTSRYSAATKKWNLPPFSAAVEVGLIRDFLDIYSPATECPREYLWSSFITSFGLALSQFVARANSFQTQPRLYVCNVGTSGVTRKSTGADFSISQIQQALGPSYVQSVKGFGSSEGLLRALQRAEGVPVLNYIDELELLFKKTMVSGSAGITPLHILYEGNHYDHPLKTGSITVENANLGMLANSTLDRFPDLWQAENIDSGFLSRWMLVVGNPSTRLADPPPPDPKLVVELNQKLESLAKQVSAKQPRPNKLLIDFSDPDARSEWKNFYIREIDPNDQVYNRIDTFGDRLMMILALAQGRLDIDIATVQATIEFLRYEVAVRRLLCPIDANNDVARVQQKIIANLCNVGDSKSRREIYRDIHADRFGTEVFDRAIKGLCGLGTLKIEGGKYVRIG